MTPESNPRAFVPFGVTGLLKFCTVGLAATAQVDLSPYRYGMSSARY